MKLTGLQIRNKEMLEDLQKTIKEFESIKLAAKELNIGRCTISKICNGKIKKLKKYIFKFKEEC